MVRTVVPLYLLIVEVSPSPVRPVEEMSGVEGSTYDINVQGNSRNITLANHAAWISGTSQVGSANDDIQLVVVSEEETWRTAQPRSQLERMDWPVLVIPNFLTDSSTEWQVWPVAPQPSTLEYTVMLVDVARQRDFDMLPILVADVNFRWVPRGLQTRGLEAYLGWSPNSLEVAGLCAEHVSVGHWYTQVQEEEASCTMQSHPGVSQVFQKQLDAADRLRAVKVWKRHHLSGAHFVAMHQFVLVKPRKCFFAVLQQEFAQWASQAELQVSLVKAGGFPVRGEQVILHTRSQFPVSAFLVKVVGAHIRRRNLDSANVQVLTDKVYPQRQCDVDWTCSVTQGRNVMFWGQELLLHDSATVLVVFDRR